MARIFWWDEQLPATKEGRVKERVVCVVHNVSFPLNAPILYSRALNS